MADLFESKLLEHRRKILVLGVQLVCGAPFLAGIVFARHILVDVIGHVHPVVAVGACGGTGVAVGRGIPEVDARMRITCPVLVAVCVVVSEALLAGDGAVHEERGHEGLHLVGVCGRLQVRGGADGVVLVHPLVGLAFAGVGLGVGLCPRRDCRCQNQSRSYKTQLAAGWCVKIFHKHSIVLEKYLRLLKMKPENEIYKSIM